MDIFNVSGAFMFVQKEIVMLPLYLAAIILTMILAIQVYNKHRTIRIRYKTDRYTGQKYWDIH